MYQVHQKTLVKPYDHVLEADPALDWERVPEKDRGDIYKRYTETRDESLLPLKPGAEPTRWLVRRLAGRSYEVAARLQVIAATTNRGIPATQRPMNEFLYSYTQMGLVGWSGLLGPDGEEVEFKSDVDPDTRVTIVSEESMGVLQGLRVQYDIGEEIWRSTFLSPLSGKG